MSLSINTWYLLQVEFRGVGNVLGTLFASDGRTVLGTLSHNFNTSLVGGVSFRAFGGIQGDTISFCP
jgi:hypothetical protein